jgi:type 1 glutamine amidotransferase
LADADLLFVSVRRQVLPPEEFQPIRDYVESGKPIVGVRTASHAFATRSGRDAESDGVQWPEFDAEILGGNYHGHTDNKGGTPPTLVWPVAKHPVLEGVEAGPWITTSWLYLTAPLAPNARVLMLGYVDGEGNAQPVTWTNTGAYGNRVFYTSLGHPDDFADPRFRRLLLNGILWAAGEPTHAAIQSRAAVR